MKQGLDGGMGLKRNAQSQKEGDCRLRHQYPTIMKSPVHQPYRRSSNYSTSEVILLCLYQLGVYSIDNLLLRTTSLIPSSHAIAVACSISQAGMGYPPFRVRSPCRHRQRMEERKTGSKLCKVERCRTSRQTLIKDSDHRG
jgi:hypothetical protein